MSITYQRPFPIPRWQPASDTDPAFAKALDRLRNALAGHEPELEGTIAAALLQSTGWPGATALLGEVLSDPNQTIDVRVAAAHSLWRTGTPESLNLLKAAARTEQPRVCATIIKMIGRFGDADSLAIVRQAKRLDDDPAVLRAVRLAETLIAHRQDLSLVQETVSADEEWTPSDRRVTLRVERGNEFELKRILQGLERTPLGIDFASDLGYEVICLRRRFMLMFRRDLPTPVDLGRHKALLGVAAAFDEANDEWAPALYLLTTPDREQNSVRADVLWLSGRRVAVGHGQIENDSIQFEFVGIRAPGAFPLHLRGSLDSDYRLQFETAEVGPSTEKLKPTSYFPPPISTLPHQ